ncbi:MAG: hypothetical protein KIH44_004475 [Octadecabacter sp.]|nr:hypothetical protein [Octadecabacter sp.]
MFQRLAVVCGLALLPMAAQAENQITGFMTHLGPSDAVSSRGVQLNDLCAIVQQDRANYHRFGLREELDSSDPVFASTDRRAMIADRCEYDHSYYRYAGDNIRSGTRYYLVYVRVFGSGDQITRITIEEGAG